MISHDNDRPSLTNAIMELKLEINLTCHFQIDSHFVNRNTQTLNHDYKYSKIPYKFSIDKKQITLIIVNRI